MMLRKCCKRFLSLGFASLIEPVYPASGNFTPNGNTCWRNVYEDMKIIGIRSFSMKSRPVSAVNVLKIEDCSKMNSVSNGHNCQVKTYFSTSSLYCLDKMSKGNMNEVKPKADGEIVEEEVDESNQSIFQRFKTTYKKHGKILLGVHVATSAVWFGSFYYVARSGIDVVSWMEAYNFPPTIITPFKHAGLGDLAVMYLLYKVATPIRYTVTLGGTNIAIRYLKKTGYIEPISPEDSIRGLMKDSSDKIKEKRSELVEQSREKIKSFRDKDKEKS